MELKPRIKSVELTINAYANDVKTLKEFISKLNEVYSQSAETEGEYAEEDIFACMQNDFFDRRPEFKKLLKTDGRATRHRPKTENQPSLEDAGRAANAKEPSGKKGKAVKVTKGALDSSNQRNGATADASGQVESNARRE